MAINAWVLGYRSTRRELRDGSLVAKENPSAIMLAVSVDVDDAMMASCVDRCSRPFSAARLRSIRSGKDSWIHPAPSTASSSGAAVILPGRVANTFSVGGRFDWAG